MNNIINDILEVDKMKGYDFTDDDFTIDVIDVLKELKNNSAEIIIPDEYNTWDRIDEFIDSMGLEELKRYNTYTWDSPLSHHMQYTIYKDNYVLLMVHRYGDVRGNYTDYVLIKIDDFTIFEEVLYTCNKYITREVNGVKYDININIFNDSFEVYDEGGSYIGVIYGYDEGEVLKELKELVNEG